MEELKEIKSKFEKWLYCPAWAWVEDPLKGVEILLPEKTRPAGSFEIYDRAFMDDHEKPIWGKIWMDKSILKFPLCRNSLAFKPKNGNISLCVIKAEKPINFSMGVEVYEIRCLYFGQKGFGSIDGFAIVKYTYEPRYFDAWFYATRYLEDALKWHEENRGIHFS